MDQYFSELGFSARERDVYQKLLSTGGATPNELAKILKSPRASVYSALAVLEQRGLAYRENRHKSVRYLPHRPAALSAMVERERESLLTKSKAQAITAQKLIPLLEPLLDKAQAFHPQVVVFEGRASVERMLTERLAAWKSSIKQYDHTWWGYQDHDLIESYASWFRLAAANHQAPEMVKLLSNQSPTETLLRGKISRREIRLVPPTMAFSSTIWVMGDYLISIMTRQEPHCAFEIYNAALAHNLRTVFSMLWTLSENVQPSKTN